MTNEAKAELILSSTVSFLAQKHGVAEQTIVRALADKNEKIVDQFAELAALGVSALSN